jgi:hypothetical protein
LSQSRRERPICMPAGFSLRPPRNSRPHPPCATTAFCNKTTPARDRGGFVLA